MRIDKLLSELKYATRKESKLAARKGDILVDGIVCKDTSKHVDPSTQVISFQGETIEYKEHIYILMNKPKNVVSAVSDPVHETVCDLVFPTVRQDVFPVGRLDKDTTGLLLLTNDGDFSHRVIHNKQGIEKTYRVVIEHPLSSSDVELLKHGIQLDEEELLPARIEIVNDTEILLSIKEGKYHQVKRMLHAVDNEVLELERIAIGGLTVINLDYGEFRELNEEDFDLIGVQPC